MKTTPFLDENTEPDPPKDPKRDGYRFVKWNRFEEYDEEGNLVNVRYEAVWEEVADEETAASGSGKSKSKGTKTGDASLPYLYGSFAVLSAAGLLVLRRRRKTDR
jgi:LPXTG-motif cell wall-anchored protein